MSIECRKTKTKVSLVDRFGQRKHEVKTCSVGKRVRIRHDWVWFYCCEESNNKTKAYYYRCFYDFHSKVETVQRRFKIKALY